MPAWYGMVMLGAFCTLLELGRGNEVARFALGVKYGVINVKLWLKEGIMIWGSAAGKSRGIEQILPKMVGHSQ